MSLLPRSTWLVPTRCVSGDEGAAGHKPASERGETAGAQDNTAWLPGNGGHHSNTVSFGGAGSPSTPHLQKREEGSSGGSP